MLSNLVSYSKHGRGWNTEDLKKMIFAAFILEAAWTSRWQDLSAVVLQKMMSQKIPYVTVWVTACSHYFGLYFPFSFLFWVFFFSFLFLHTHRCRFTLLKGFVLKHSPTWRTHNPRMNTLTRAGVRVRILSSAGHPSSWRDAFDKASSGARHAEVSAFIHHDVGFRRGDMDRLCQISDTAEITWTTRGSL